MEHSREENGTREGVKEYTLETRTDIPSRGEWNIPLRRMEHSVRRIIHSEQENGTLQRR